MEMHDTRSSSNDLSSAPPSDAESTPGPPNHHPVHRDFGLAGNLGVANSFSARQTQASPGAGVSASPATAAGVRQDNGAAAPPVRRPRKKRDPNTPEEKKPRVPRKPRGTALTTTGVRKKTKIEPPDPGSTILMPRLQSADLQSSTLVQPVLFSPPGATESRRDEADKFTGSGLTMHNPPMPARTPPQRIYEYKPREYDSKPRAPPPPPPTPPLPPQSSPARSTSMYDPIRSVQRPVDTNPPAPPSIRPTVTPPRRADNPSTSPTISSIIDHPPRPDISTATTVVTHQVKTEPPHGQADGRVVDSPGVNGNSSAMDVDHIVPDQVQPKKPASSRKVPSEASTRPTSPKPARSKEQPPPPPMGSGLLSASLFGGDSSSDMPKDSEKGPNIVLHVDLKDPGNRVINFARMAEEKYGFAALYPRQAAQKERLAKIAAAGAALERSASGSKFGGTSAGDSGDEDLSVDIERDSDNDGDVAMSGVNGGQEPANSGTDGPGPKRRRRRKVEEYDQDDPFVDDSELLWEAQAAASKDGFFVYCGPLVPEGEKPAVERADGTIKRGRGRGRGGGPGSRGGRTAAGASERGSGRGGGPGSRGGGITRKPRITKDDRAQMEREKLQREKMAPLVAKPTAYPG
ncbi:HPC2 and ubinuclein domain-containing protein [Cladophialophora immunda]|nr:HPC2 and ubinuclein domain-containing protein [Cladophialophora immunda]